MQTWNKCRYKNCEHRDQIIFSHQTGVKYGPRHYMHASCYVKSGKPFADLNKHDAGLLPYFAVKYAGRLPELENILEKI